MARDKLSDGEAKAILLKWPQRTAALWERPDDRGYWLRCQPGDGNATGPRLSAAGTSIYQVQPDGLWAYFSGLETCDVVAVECCGTIQNLNDKRVRYVPTLQAVGLSCKAAWFRSTIQVHGGGQRTRWEATDTIGNEPEADTRIPVRSLRVLYALPNQVYFDWTREHVPTGYEYFCPHSALDSYNSQKCRPSFSECH